MDFIDQIKQLGERVIKLKDNIATEMIHKQHLKTDKDCCDYTGLEYTYFKLINNRFTIKNREVWEYTDKKSINQTIIH